MFFSCSAMKGKDKNNSIDRPNCNSDLGNKERNDFSLF